MVNVNADKAWIFRIVHRENVNRILDRGLECAGTVNPATYRNIGNTELIDKRSHRIVPIPPGGTLSDYVPFYFTYASPMLLNIKTGRGVPAQTNADIIFVVTSLHRIIEIGGRFVFTDRHAYLKAAEFFDELASLDQIDWNILQRKDFKRDPKDPTKMERYMAEALAFRGVPLDGILGFTCYNEQVAEELRQALLDRAIQLPVHALPSWYF